jgi:hypothetical protein
VSISLLDFKGIKRVAVNSNWTQQLKSESAIEKRFRQAAVWRSHQFEVGHTRVLGCDCAAPCQSCFGAKSSKI